MQDISAKYESSINTFFQILSHFGRLKLETMCLFVGGAIELQQSGAATLQQKEQEGCFSFSRNLNVLPVCDSDTLTRPYLGTLAFGEDNCRVGDVSRSDCSACFPLWDDVAVADALLNTFSLHCSLFQGCDRSLPRGGVGRGTLWTQTLFILLRQIGH